MKAIGEGSYGTVYEAKNKYDKKHYAIKVFKRPFVSPYTARQTYREVKILRKLSEMETNIFTQLSMKSFYQ